MINPAPLIPEHSGSLGAAVEGHWDDHIAILAVVFCHREPGNVPGCGKGEISGYTCLLVHNKSPVIEKDFPTPAIHKTLRIIACEALDEVLPHVVRCADLCDIALD